MTSDCSRTECEFVDLYTPTTSTKHLKKTKSFKCWQCRNYFRTANSLKEHLKSHIGRASFKCLQCRKSFARSRDLKEHFKMHTREKPFNCIQCRESFAESLDFEAHLRMHTKGELHDQEDAKWIVIRRPLRGHDDMPCGRPDRRVGAPAGRNGWF
jgi:hypothetical protein